MSSISMSITYEHPYKICKTLIQYTYEQRYYQHIELYSQHHEIFWLNRQLLLSKPFVSDMFCVFTLTF
jgi:hypothetical protein